MTDKWTDKLSDYLDGELGAKERVQLEEHLSSCPECSNTLEQLLRVVARARSLEDRGPEADIWSGIADRINAAGIAEVVDLEERGQRRPVREWRLTFSFPQLAAAGIALMVLSAGTAWMVSKAAAPEVSDIAAVEAGGAMVEESADVRLATSYDAAVMRLEQILQESRDQLDTLTVRIIEENLMIIDKAIAQAQRALAQDPASFYLKEHLAATKQQKLEFLRRAAQMAGSIS